MVWSRGTVCARSAATVWRDREMGAAVLAFPRLLSGRGLHEQRRWCRGRSPDKVSGLGVAGGELSLDGAHGVARHCVHLKSLSSSSSSKAGPRLRIIWGASGARERNQDSDQHCTHSGLCFIWSLPSRCSTQWPQELDFEIFEIFLNGALAKGLRVGCELFEAKWSCLGGSIANGQGVLCLNIQSLGIFVDQLK